MEENDPAEEFQAFIAELSSQSDKEQVLSELEVLKSIYGDEAIRVWHPSTPNHGGNEPRDLGTVRYEAHLNLPSPYEDVQVRILISLPPTYPATSPPQLQLLSRYIGSFGVDAALFGSILRTYISISGIEWTPDTICVFDGLQSVLERCSDWYQERLSAEKAGELLREDAKEQSQSKASVPEDIEEVEGADVEVSANLPSEPSADLPAGIEIFTAEPIIDRKSQFIGRACRISEPTEVPLILAHLMADRRISRAAHPIINAWRCQVGNVLHQDNDDDGETAAGGRLAHLLQILELNNVLVIVTRYFGGIHLGPDRFKHINQAARNALDLGGFLDAPESSKKSTARARRH
ncbi:UPF0029-domain-containing protein [Pluteus cervinus]|uniref:UPF0029-domain-containing protein n=1 Tax=Pluteus cervinus TaxID=181527 RepID=A0ACD3B2B9_9AGAR|nr:UPF0029-domain-containing protein [Pluteus cervinus]